MVKLYKRAIALIQAVAELDRETCPNQNEMAALITEARDVLKAIEAV